MKIGILTHHWLDNFGANLQAYATQQSLRKMGFEPIIIDYQIPELEEIYSKKVPSCQRNYLREFSQRHYSLSPKCRSMDELMAIAKDAGFYAVISGSDAVLRLSKDSHREDLQFPNPFWLTWCEKLGIEKTGFLAASSMGSQYFELDKKTRNGIREATMNLSVCSVRDRWTEWMLRICGVSSSKIAHSADPVVVLPDALVDNASIECEPPGEPYVLMSLYDGILDSSWIREFVSLSHKRGYQVFALPHPDTSQNGPFDRILELPMSPFEWYSWIANAVGYVGVRFHPIMLAQVNRVPYVALDEYDVGLKLPIRYIGGFARRMQRFTRTVSKTYDASLRVGLHRYCIAPRDYRIHSPLRVWEMLESQLNDPLSESTVETRKRSYLNALKQIVGGS